MSGWNIGVFTSNDVGIQPMACGVSRCWITPTYISQVYTCFWYHVPTWTVWKHIVFLNPVFNIPQILCILDSSKNGIFHASTMNSSKSIQIKHLNFTMIGSHGSRRPMLLRRGKLRIVIVGTPSFWNKLRFENVVAFGPPLIVSVNVSGGYINCLDCYFVVGLLKLSMKLEPDP